MHSNYPSFYSSYLKYSKTFHYHSLHTYSSFPHLRFATIRLTRHLHSAVQTSCSSADPISISHSFVSVSFNPPNVSVTRVVVFQSPQTRLLFPPDPAHSKFSGLDRRIVGTAPSPGVPLLFAYNTRKSTTYYVSSLHISFSRFFHP